jgi:RNA-directed DNA polymerase
MKRNGIASDNLMVEAAALPQDEFVSGHGSQPASIQPKVLLERVLERPNLQRALKQVRQNKGAPGIDGMSVDDLPRHLKEHWPEIRAQLMAGTYRPQPVKRVEIPKPDGKKRPLGIPTVVDRFIQQAMPKALRGAGSRANHQRRMGTPLPPQQLRVPPPSLGTSGRAASSGGHPRRVCLGG